MSAASQAGRARDSAVERPQGAPRSRILLVAMLAILAYFMLPLFWLAISSTKSTSDLFSTFGLWLADEISLVENVGETLTHDGGIYLVWVRNTLVYAIVAAGGATALATLGGYGFAKFRFRGNQALTFLVLGAIAVPTTALAIPTYLLFAQADLVDTPWAVILPSLVSPFGLFLMRIYTQTSVSDELIEAGRIDGAGEGRIFLQIVLRTLAPAMITVLLFTLVATWNNYFLPLIMLHETDIYPITVGLAQWSSQAHGGGGSNPNLLALVVTGSLLSIIPLVAAFVILQRYWQSGLSAGSIKG
jgi:multiple sugar transport system permease protein